RVTVPAPTDPRLHQLAGAVSVTPTPEGRPISGRLPRAHLPCEGERTGVEGKPARAAQVVLGSSRVSWRPSSVFARRGPGASCHRHGDCCRILQEAYGA